MKTKHKIVYKQLEKLYQKSEKIQLPETSKVVIFSDLHMGNGKSVDDFKPNATLFKTVLQSYYFSSNYTLVLNGDVEELQRFSLKKILQTWNEWFTLFNQFQQQSRLFKTFGNHDWDWAFQKNQSENLPVKESYRLQIGKYEFFIFHGHQASKKYQKHNQVIGLALKYVFNPLGIKNYSVSHSSKKQYKIEKRVYEFSSFKKVISIIGHTHRPLFESLHRVEHLKYKIEELVRKYVTSSGDKEDIKEKIKYYKKELKKYHRKTKKSQPKEYIYHTLFNIPCLFNSGCVIGKRGMTCLEIENGEIRLVHWFQSHHDHGYKSKDEVVMDKLPGTDIFRVVMNSDSLEFIGSRIELLA